MRACVRACVHACVCVCVCVRACVRVCVAHEGHHVLEVRVKVVDDVVERDGDGPQQEARLAAGERRPLLSPSEGALSRAIAQSPFRRVELERKRV